MYTSSVNKQKSNLHISSSTNKTAEIPILLKKCPKKIISPQKEQQSNLNKLTKINGESMDGINSESDNHISSCSTLEIDNKVQNTPISDLENQVNELKKKLKLSEKECNEYKRKLDEAIEEKERSYRRLEVISSSHESRITEMHCVIAELNKKLRNQQELTIFEENEPEGGSEFSFQEGSVYNSENNLTNPDAECQTEPIDDSEIPHPELISGGTITIPQHIMTDAATRTQVEALQEEVLHLKAQIALLQSQIANEDSSPEALKNETIDKISITSSPHEKSCDNDSSSHENNFEDDEQEADDEIEIIEEENNIISNRKQNHRYLQHNAILSPSENNEKLITEDNNHKNYSRKYAKRFLEEKWMSSIGLNSPGERIKSKKSTDNEIIDVDEVNNAEIGGHLVANIVQSDNLMTGFNGPGELQSELQRLQRRIEHLKIRNSVLTLTLDECKEHCEHLYLLCGKYESNAIALQLALNYSDRAIEAYDVMLALLESKLAILQEDNEAAEESRKAVESVARHLLDRFESEKNLTENSMGPWQNNFFINSSKKTDPWTAEDDNRLRNHVSKLKGRRSTIQNTVVELESPFSCSDYKKIRNTFEMKKDKKNTTDCCNVDLEMAILMQELMNLREDIVESKQKVEISEREKKMAFEKIFALEDALSQLQSQFSTELETPLSIISKDRHSYSEAEHAALIERQLVEALTRESQLKTRIQALVESVTATKKSSDEKYIQVQNNIAELQKTNMNLSQSLEMSKRKYQYRIKRLEQTVLELQQRNKDNEIVPETTL